MKNIILALLITVLLVITGCGTSEQNTWNQVKENKKLVVGMSADYKPFEFQNEKGEIVGFDIDILNAITDKLGVELEIVNTNFDGLIPGLKSKKYDIVMSAMTITDERKGAVNFSDPYFDASQVIAIKADNDAIKNPEDLEGKVVGVQLGTTGDLEASKIKDLEDIKRFNVIPEAFIALKNGQIDAIVNDLPVTKAYIKDNPEVKIVGKPLTVENYGIAFRKNDEQLLAKINEGLKKIREEGIYDKIYKKWNENE